MNIRPFTSMDTEAVVQLWHDCALVRPWNDPYKDIARKCGVTPELFLVGTEDTDAVMASIMIGYDGHRGWINYLAVHPRHQRRGHASRLMQQAEAQLTARGCPKLSLQIRAGNEALIGFYASLGYADDHTVSMGKRLIPDH